MKHLIVLLACVLLTFPATAQPSTKWVYVGIYKQERKQPCVNPVNVAARGVWLKFDATFDAQRKLLVAGVRSQLGAGNYDLKDIYVKVGTDYYIAKVVKQRKCSDNGVTQYVSSYWFYGGVSKADIEDQMAKNGRDYPENVSQRIEELIDCRVAIPR